MLNRMHRVMESQLCFVKGSPSLRAAHRGGCIEWRDFYGGVTMKEIFAHLTRGDVLHAHRRLPLCFGMCEVVSS